MVRVVITCEKSGHPGGGQCSVVIYSWLLAEKRASGAEPVFSLPLIGQSCLAWVVPPWQEG